MAENKRSQHDLRNTCLGQLDDLQEWLLPAECDMYAERMSQNKRYVYASDAPWMDITFTDPRSQFDPVNYQS
jgi:hypothetical protein